MTSFDRFERSLPELFDELAVLRTPDYTDALLARTAATRQRPGWTFPERWIPMSALTRSLAAVPRFQLRLIVAVAFLIVAAIVGVLVAGSLTLHRPPPFGPALNGQIAFIDGAGQIGLGDPVTGTSHIVIAGSGTSRITFSRDGSRFAFLRAGTGGSDLMVADADGSHVRAITAAPMAPPAFMAWTPRGDRIVTTDSAGTLWLFDASQAAEPSNLSRKLGVGPVQVGPGHNDDVAHVFRPPTGDDLLFVTRGSEVRLQTARVDGTGLHTLLDPSTSGLDYSDLVGAQWSPDGAQIVIMVELQIGSDRWHHLYVVDADGANLHPLSSLSTEALVDQGSPLWSPNGKMIAFQYWRNQSGDPSITFNPIGVVDVATGQLRDLGPTLINGATWAWSPDGLSILELPANPPGDGHMLIINAATGATSQAPWIVSDLSWQRTAP